jgi:HSP20 family molecular chaperone IbpA
MKHFKKKMFLFLLISFLAGMSPDLPEVQAKDVQTIDVVVKGEDDQSAAKRSALDLNAYDGLWTANPQSMLQGMEQRMQSVFNDPFFTGTSGSAMFNPQGRNIDEGDHHYQKVDGKIILSCTVGGAVDSTIDIDIKDNIVAIQGMKESSSEDKQQGQNGSAHVYSSSRSQFYRSFPLHADADPERYKVEINGDTIKIIFDKKNV